MTPRSGDGSLLQDRRATLETVLRLQYAPWETSGLRYIAHGMECAVFSVETTLGLMAIKVPWQREICNDNDPEGSMAERLQREQRLCVWLSGSRIPVPHIFALHRGDLIDFLAMAYIAADPPTVAGKQAGQALWHLHQASPPDWMMGQTRSGNAVELADRLTRRLQTVQKITGISLPSREWKIPTIAAILERDPSPPAVLHMGLRPENLLYRSGHLAALIDWSNSRVSSPLLEIARIAEYGQLTPDFLDGYDSYDFSHAPALLTQLYRLDTAAMLALVFLSEAPDPLLAGKQMRRLVQLLHSAQAAALDAGVNLTQ